MRIYLLPDLKQVCEIRAKAVLLGLVLFNLEEFGVLLEQLVIIEDHGSRE